tara:strand:+ start:360 stop:536 length:177 start_codon:yes stop_codon:yes gene_type:complete
MTAEGPRKIRKLILEIFMPIDLEANKYKIPQRSAELIPVKHNLEDCVEIKMNWNQEKF